MSSIASLLASGSSTSVQGNRGKASSNSEGEAFAKQLSENKPAKADSSQNTQGNSIETDEDIVVDEGNTPERHHQSSGTSKLDQAFKSDVTPTILDVEVPIDEVKLGTELDAVLTADALTDISLEKIAISLENPASKIDENAIVPDAETVSTDQGILSVLNRQLNNLSNIQAVEQSVLAEQSDVKTPAIENNTLLSGDLGVDAPAIEITPLNGQASVQIQSAELPQSQNPQLNTIGADIALPDAKLPENSSVGQLDADIEPQSANIVEINKVITKNSESSVASSLAVNIDATKTENTQTKTNSTQNIETVKLPANLANLANGDGLSDKGADQQRDGGAHQQQINQVDKAGIKVDGVDVLEARVFPALSPSNGANIADALIKTRQLSSNSAVQNADPIYDTSQPKMVNTLKIQLVPANLGVVTAVMKLAGEELQVQLQVDNIEAYRKLSADSASIVNTLKNQGFGIEQVNVQLTSGDRGAGQQGSQQSGQSFQGQAQQDASSSFDRDRRDQNTTNSNEQSQELGNHESDVLQTPKAPDLSSGVYL